MFAGLQLDAQSDVPLYRQVFVRLNDLIRSGQLPHGGRLPATRELAGMLGVNRATVSAAYELLEAEGLIAGQVGRGSFVTGAARGDAGEQLDWQSLLAWPEWTAAPVVPASREMISFAASRPSEQLFPMEEFRATCREVTGGNEAGAILQLGSPGGYAPLRHYLMDLARRDGLMRSGDDIIVTSGCQQALDLLQRVLIRPGDRVAVEDPVYPGLKNLFTSAGAQAVGVPLGVDGIDLEQLERVLGRERPKALVVTSNFQNPTGATIPAASRAAILRMTRAAGVVLVENDTYGALRYQGAEIPPLKHLDERGDVVLLRSFSKIAFPGLRVGWAIGPRALIARMTEAKQLSDLHTDQLSQAVMLRFAESGRLAAHRKNMLRSGAERLTALLAACGRHLPEGARFTRPEGGMNIWVRLPEPLDAGELLPRVQQEGVTYLPGKYFTVTRPEAGGLRLSFAGLEPHKIRAGVAAMGRVFSRELERTRVVREPEPAMV